MKDKILYTPGEAMELMKTDKVVLIDIRDSDDYAESHIQGAVNLPDIFYYLAETTPEGLEKLHEHFRQQLSAIGLTPDTTAIVYEDAYDSRYGGSCRGYWLLRYLGHARTGVLDGGFSAWLEEGLPADAEPVPTTPVDFAIDPQPEMLATRDEVLNCLDKPDVKLLDIRDRVEWDAKSSSPYGVDFAPARAACRARAGWSGTASSNATARSRISNRPRRSAPCAPSTDSIPKTTSSSTASRAHGPPTPMWH